LQYSTVCLILVGDSKEVQCSLPYTTSSTVEPIADITSQGTLTPIASTEVNSESVTHTMSDLTTTESSSPTTEPSSPTTEPISPTTESSSPTTESSSPTTEPISPTTESSSPTTESSSPSTAHTDQILVSTTASEGNQNSMSTFTVKVSTNGFSSIEQSTQTSSTAVSSGVFVSSTNAYQDTSIGTGESMSSTNLDMSSGKNIQTTIPDTTEGTIKPLPQTPAESINQGTLTPFCILNSIQFLVPLNDLPHPAYVHVLN